MDGDYSAPYAMPIPNFVTMRIVAQTLAQRAQCNFLLNRPEKALQDLTLMHEMCRLLEGAPTGKPITLVAAMINVAVHGLYLDTVGDGFRLGVWQEPQIVELQKQLNQINLPAVVALAIETEPAATTHTLKTLPKLKLYEWFSIGGKPTTLWQKIKNLEWAFIPQGWIYQSMATDAKLVYKQTDGFDSANDIIQPKKFDDLIRELKTIAWPYKIFAATAMPNFTKAWQTTAHHQTLINEAQIACALERYHLAHNEYPETLDALVPQFIEKLPHDIIGGKPLHYRRTDDPPSQGSGAARGKFLLYSVGWNETDDDGLDLSQTKTGSVDYSQGDWVWKN
jgi:hypothetical protein